jgi:hypothetical protein
MIKTFEGFWVQHGHRGHVNFVVLELHQFVSSGHRADTSCGRSNKKGLPHFIVLGLSLPNGGVRSSKWRPRPVPFQINILVRPDPV